MSIDTNNWAKFGQSSNADFHQIDEHTLAVVPVEGCTDDENTAKAGVDIQEEYLSSKGKKAGTIIFAESINWQTTGARNVDRNLPDPAYQVCFDLVGGTAFGRAVGSFFLGLSKPRALTQMSATFEHAPGWCHARANNS